MGRELMHVLVVEDDMAMQPLWKIIFGRMSGGVSIHWAVSVEAAETELRAALLAGKRIDLIISDLFLAGPLTGIDFLKSTIVRECGAKTMLVSAAASDRLAEHCDWDLPDSVVVAKPLNLVRCERALERLLESRESSHGHPQEG